MSDPYGSWAPAPVTAEHVWLYTSAQGLVGILTDRVLWASECTSMNDLSEITEGFEYIKRWLAQDGSRTAQELATLLRDDTLQWARRVFVLCASKNGDDAGQWRLYGGARAAYAVQLDTAASFQVVSRSASTAPVTDPLPLPRGEVFLRRGRLAGLRRRRATSHRAKSRDRIQAMFRTYAQSATVSPWYPVAYTRTEWDALLGDLLTWAKLRLDQYDADRLDPSVSVDEVDFIGQTLGEDFSEALSTAAALIKAEGFSGEQEARMIVDAGAVLGHVEFRASDHGLVRYVRLTQSTGSGTAPGRVVAEAPDQTLPITGVRMRNTPYSKEQARTLRSMLQRAGLPAGVEIDTSSIALRW